MYKSLDKINIKTQLSKFLKKKGFKIIVNNLVSGGAMEQQVAMEGQKKSH